MRHVSTPLHEIFVNAEYDFETTSSTPRIIDSGGEQAAVTEHGGSVTLYSNHTDPRSIVASIDRGWGGRPRMVRRRACFMRDGARERSALAAAVATSP
jgi:hypothetical protein